MSEGMMWFSQKPDLRQAVLEAAARFAEKNGQEPNFCHVHPAAMPQWDQPRISRDDHPDIVLTADPAMPNQYHYLVGVTEQPAKPARPLLKVFECGAVFDADRQPCVDCTDYEVCLGLYEAHFHTW